MEATIKIAETAKNQVYINSLPPNRVSFVREQHMIAVFVGRIAKDLLNVFLNCHMTDF